MAVYGDLDYLSGVNSENFKDDKKEIIEMVWIANEDAERFPKFAEFVYSTVIKATGDAKVRNAMVFAALTPLQTADKELLVKIMNSFNVGGPPRIAPKFFRSPQTDIDAEYDHLGNVINIAARHALDFNNSPENKELQRFLKATVLHELVHYLDYLADSEFQDYEIRGKKKIRKKEVEERGFVFERLAFGECASKVGGIVSCE